MPLTANISLVVAALPDNDVWFANNAAWQAYWNDLEIAATFDPAVTTAYSESAFDNTLPNYVFDVGGVEYNVPTIAQFNSLLLAYQTLNTNYKNLKTALIAAGVIDA